MAGADVGSKTTQRWIRGGIEEDANRHRRRVLLRTHANLTTKPQQGGTPRDTGRATSGWVPSVGAPSSYVPGDSPGAPINADAVLPPAKGMNLRHDLFETNLVPYIGALNRGHSKQARPRFIERAVDAALKAEGAD